MSVRNDARFVAESIESILRQTAADFEFIIFDDGSIDSSRQVISSFRDARIKMFTLGGVGLAAALNEGLGMARGTYVARQDADDISAPERFDQQIAYLESNPEIDVLGTAITAIDQEGRRLRDYEYPLTDAEIRQELCQMRNPLVHGSLMYRRQRILDIHGYRPAFRKSEDYDMHLRAARRLKFANLQTRLLRYRVRLDSMSGGRDEEALQYSLLARALDALRNAGIEDSDEVLHDFQGELAAGLLDEALPVSPSPVTPAEPPRSRGTAGAGSERCGVSEPLYGSIRYGRFANTFFMPTHIGARRLKTRWLRSFAPPSKSAAIQPRLIDGMNRMPQTDPVETTFHGAI